MLKYKSRTSQFWEGNNRIELQFVSVISLCHNIAGSNGLFQLIKFLIINHSNFIYLLEEEEEEEEQKYVKNKLY